MGLRFESLSLSPVLPTRKALMQFREGVLIIIII
jgi:hypothetical protein